LIEIEVQNETHQSQETLRFAAVPRIGEGIRLKSADGFWASYDVVDLWYQKAEYGDVWVPYLHVRETPAPAETLADAGYELDEARASGPTAQLYGIKEVYSFKG